MEIHYARNATAQGPRLSKFRISIDSSSNLYVCIHDFVYTHTVHTYMYIYMYTRTLFQVLQLSSYVYTWLYNVHVYAHDVVYMYCMVLLYVPQGNVARSNCIISHLETTRSKMVKVYTCTCTCTRVSLTHTLIAVFLNIFTNC